MSDRYRRLLHPVYQMIESSTHPELPQARHIDPQSIESLRHTVEKLYKETADSSHDEERRHNDRRQFPHMILVTPCDRGGHPKTDMTFVAVAKDISPKDISFVHTRAFTESRVIVTLVHEGKLPICLMTEVRRMQPAGRGLYLIAGQFVERITLIDPFQLPADMTAPPPPVPENSQHAADQLPPSDASSHE